MFTFSFHCFKFSSSGWECFDAAAAFSFLLFYVHRFPTRGTEVFDDVSDCLLLAESCVVVLAVCFGTFLQIVRAEGVHGKCSVAHSLFATLLSLIRCLPFKWRLLLLNNAVVERLIGL